MATGDGEHLGDGLSARGRESAVSAHYRKCSHPQYRRNCSRLNPVSRAMADARNERLPCGLARSYEQSWAMAEGAKRPCRTSWFVLTNRVGRWQRVRRTTALQQWSRPGTYWAMADLNCRLLPCEGSKAPSNSVAPCSSCYLTVYQKKKSVTRTDHLVSFRVGSYLGVRALEVRLKVRVQFETL